MAKKKRAKKKSFGRKLIPLAMSAIMVATPFMLAGCSNGQDGKDGAAGSQWHYGIEDPTNDIGKVGDFYLETDDGDIWVKTENGWSSQPVGNIKGPQGNPGDNGQSVTSYVGYDGYYWNGPVRTTQKAVSTLGEYISENTLGLVNQEYDEYFGRYDINLAEQKLALMSNYIASNGKTGYSGLGIAELKINLKTGGTLQISTAKLSDIVDRDGISEITLSKTITKSVVAGLNTIDLTGFTVPEDSTIVLSSTDNVIITATTGIKCEDEQGYFANLSNTDLYAVTTDTTLAENPFDTKDRIPLKITVDLIKVGAQTDLITHNGVSLTTHLSNLGETTAVEDSSSKYAFGGIGANIPHVLAMYENTSIEKIRIIMPNNPTTAVEDCYMTVFRVNVETGKVLQTCKFYADIDELNAVINETASNRVVSLTRKAEDIETEGELICREGEALMFKDVNDPLAFGYMALNDATCVFREFYTGNFDIANHSATIVPPASTFTLGIDVVVRTSYTFVDYVRYLRNLV